MALFVFASLTGCSLVGDEADARGALHEFFSDAKNGEIEKALMLVAPENPTALLLKNLKESDPVGFKTTLAQNGERLRTLLSDAQLQISSVIVKGERCAIAGMILRPEAEEKPFTITLVKRGGKWLLESLPEILLAGE
jgi:hypothetical protein